MDSNKNDWKTIKISTQNDSSNLEYYKTIEIPLEEYKELLIIKGKYEELKSLQITPITVNPLNTKITYRDAEGKEISHLSYPYEVTC